MVYECVICKSVAGSQVIKCGRHKCTFRSDKSVLLLISNCSVEEKKAFVYVHVKKGDGLQPYLAFVLAAEKHACSTNQIADCLHYVSSLHSGMHMHQSDCITLT